ncbi:MAG: hypothetical protein H6502_01750 [Candidatus Woesearchaeota archaeon]|nr:MAG: hypothetical protein H6502_01750 [Candidatus Woesearchaeota archaeon]
MNKGHLRLIAEYLPREDVQAITTLLKKNLITVTYEQLRTTIVRPKTYPQLQAKQSDGKLENKLRSYNTFIEERFYQKVFREFSSVAFEKINYFFERTGFKKKEITNALILSLFAKNPTHLLLLGDPEQGQNELLSSVSTLSPIGVIADLKEIPESHLYMKTINKKREPGCIAEAHDGILILKHLQFKSDAATHTFAKALDTGKTTFKRGKAEVHVTSNFSCIATSYPDSFHFVGKRISFLHGQLMFPQTLLQDFSLVFLLRRSPQQEFFREKNFYSLNMHTQDINDPDIEFVRKYIEYAREHTIDFAQLLKAEVADFVESLMGKKEYFIEPNKNTIKGIINLAKARAALHLRKDVTTDDLEFVFSIVKESAISF